MLLSLSLSLSLNFQPNTTSYVVSFVLINNKYRTAEALPFWMLLYEKKWCGGGGDGS
jgi:hypothetical protein